MIELPFLFPSFASSIFLHCSPFGSYSLSSHYSCFLLRSRQPLHLFYSAHHLHGHRPSVPPISHTHSYMLLYPSLTFKHFHHPSYHLAFLLHIPVTLLLSNFSLFFHVLHFFFPYTPLVPSSLPHSPPIYTCYFVSP